MSGDVVTIFGNTTLLATDRVVLVASTGSDVVVKLPPGHATGQRHGIKDWGADGSGNAANNNIYIDPNGASLDGVPTPRLLGPANGDYINVVSDGLNWGIIP